MMRMRFLLPGVAISDFQPVFAATTQYVKKLHIGRGKTRHTSAVILNGSLDFIELVQNQWILPA
jgi:hypothetical protein